MKTYCVTMPWQTLKNSTDCGVFLMRHMETYKGERKNWDTQFKSEDQAGHQEQLVRLRIKYADAILTSHVNEKRNFVVKESKFLYNKLAGQGLLKAIIESSKKKPKARHIKKGTVLFPEDDADDVNANADDDVAKTKE